MMLPRIAGMIFVSTLGLLLLGGIALADKDTAMKRRKADQPEKYKEVLVMEWPASGNWKSGLVHTSGSTTMEFYYPAGQSASYWMEMGTTEYKPLDKTGNLAGMARMIYLGTKESSPHADWKILFNGRDDDNYAYIVFQIACPDFLSGEQPQLQYWKMIQGDQMLFTIQYSYKNEIMPEDKQLEILEAINNGHIELVEIAKADSVSKR